jgi:hypothetical protein
LALAFANPFINRSAASMGGNKLVLLVIDNSLSMRAGARLADARSAALAVLDGRNAREPAQVMALGSKLEVLTQPTEKTGELRAAVASIQPGDSRSSFGELARGVRSLAGSARTPIDLHLFSDFQKSDMPPSFAEMALPSNVTLITHPVTKNQAPNWTVESVKAPGQVWDPRKARVQAVVAGFHTPAANRTVSLVVNGKTLATQSVSVPAGGRATVEFQSLDAPYGISRCEVRIDSADALPADDRYLFSVERSDPRHVLFVHESNDPRSPLYFSSALASAAEAAFTTESVSVDRVAAVQPAQYAFVVLSDVSLPAAEEASLLNYVRGGGSILIAAGTSAARHPRVPIFGSNIVGSHYYSRDVERFLAVGETDPSHPSIVKADRWSSVRFYFAVQPDTADARVVARLTDGTPLLMEKKLGEGRVLLFTSGLDNLTNDFPLHPAFVPFVEQTARYLAGMAGRSGARVVDSFYDLRSDWDHAAGVEVVDPDGRRPLSLNEAATTSTVQLTHAGFYELRLASGRHEIVGVNADRRESDLDVISEDTMALWRGNRAPAAEPASAGRPEPDPKRPYGLCWYVMLLLFAAALAESWLSDRYLGRLREEP